MSTGIRNPAPELSSTRTQENLRAAYAHDAQAARMWEYFARVAEVEGFPEVSKVFRELAESQALFAHGHLDLLMRAGDPLTGAPVGETAQNVRAAVTAQVTDGSEVLPEMARTARAEGFMDIASWFETLVRARKSHAQRLQDALARMERP